MLFLFTCNLKRKKMMRILLMLVLCAPSWCILSAQTTREHLKNDPFRAGSNYYAYPEPSAKLTPAPKGKKPFYISTYARHAPHPHGLCPLLPLEGLPGVLHEQAQLLSGVVLTHEAKAHQRQVVVGVGTRAVLLHVSLQLVDHLLGVEVLSIGHQLQQAVVAEEFLLLVLSFIQTVGIDEQLLATNIPDTLAIEGIVLPKPEWLVGVLHLQELAVDDRLVVSAVAVVKAARI